MTIEDRSVFDFGGSLDGKIPAVAQACDLCVIHYQSKAELRPLFIMLSALAEFNRHILIVINNTESAFIPSLESGLIRETSCPAKIVKPSAFMTYLASEGLTPFSSTTRLRGGLPESPL